MKPKVRISTPPPIVAGVIAFALALALGASPALASTASNTQLSNQASVVYNDAGNIAQPPVNSNISVVTITLVPAAPTISSPVAVAVAQGSGNITLNYTVTSNANGPDSYTLALGDVMNQTAGSTATAATPITLNATTLAVAATPGTTITVPYDQVVSNATINGLVAGAVGTGSVVVIGGNTYTITNIAKNGPANTAVLTLDHALPGGTNIPANTIVPEQKTVTVTVGPGTLTAGNNTGTDTITLTGTPTNNGGACTVATCPAGTQTTPTVVTVNRAALTVTKQVSTDGGATFSNNANAPPGTTLTYRIVATNAAGSPTANAVAFTDVLPLYIAYKANSGRFATSAAITTYAGASGNPLTDNSGGYNISVNNVPSPPVTTVTYSSGLAVTAGNVLTLFFQATIN